jgi:DNA mismatch repair protein MutS
VTPGGSRLLSDWISAPLASPAAINDRLDGVDWCLEHEELREQLRRLLSAMPDLERALARITANRGGPRDLAAVRDSLACAGEAAGILAEAEDWQGFPTLFAAIGMRLSKAPDEIASTFTAALQADLPLLARDGGFIRPGFSPELDENRSLRDDTRQVIAALQTRYAEMTGLRTLRIKHNNILGYFIEVNPQQAQTLQAPELAATFIHRQTIASAVRFTTTELAGLEQKIALASGRALAIEQELFRGFCELVSEKTTAISAVAAALAETDVLVSLAELSREQRFVRPRVDDSLSFHIEGGRHPVVEARLRADGASAFTANSCDLGPAGRRLWLLTGPNMAGKSTFLRQNALITILAQMGSHVPASAAHIGVVDRLFSRVGAADDLARGRSTFMVEMVETAAILNQATERSLVILDEIGRGTATYDGLSIAWAAIEHLHETNRCRTLFATHYHELTALAGRLTQLANATVKVREWKGEVIFLHEVVPGVADRSYGIQVAKLAGLPAAVIQRASRVLRLLEQGRGDSRTLPIDDLPLFSVPHTDNTATEPDHLRNRLAEVRPDELSPREALAVLYDLKKLAEPGA